MLIEISISVMLLLFVGLYVFRTNMDTIRPRNWAMVQALTDAYLTEHLARAESVDYEELLADDSLWPAYPDSDSEEVTVGTLPNGYTITGTLVRTRVPSENNLPAAGGTGDPDTTNPARIESWSVESHLTYNIRGKTYVKSRVTIRTR
ncbi:MAG: hypothetical protein Q7Q71_07680 [Verrucomicrobiota bacterium JB023]|nr:hypothetical protein [Verrucomicrobiota bacterium JB023]